MAGFTQFFNIQNKKDLKIHKIAGKIYFFNIVFINFPTAFILAVYANGGVCAKTAFISLDLIWLTTTLLAFYWIKKGNLIKHQKYIFRSYALTLSALTFRISKYFLSNFSGWDNETIYIFDAWFAFLFNLLIAEIYIYIKFTLQSNILSKPKQKQL